MFWKSSAFAGQFVAESIAGQQHRAAIRPVAFAQYIGLRFKLPELVRQIEDRGPIVAAQRPMRRDPSNQQLKRILLDERIQVVSPAMWAGAWTISQSPTPDRSRSAIRPL